MIAINLLPGAKRKKGGKGVGFKLPDFQALAASVKDPWLLACVGGFVALGVAIGLFWVPANAKIKSLEPELKSLQNRQRQVAVALRQKAETEAKRDSLVHQITLIREIDRQRYTWPHILDAISKALPQYTWLDDMTPRATEGEGEAVSLQIQGKSADIQAITRFSRNLEESPFLEAATIVSTGVVTEQGREVFTFAMTARYQQPDTSLLTMQPLAATLLQGFRSGAARGRR